MKLMRYMITILLCVALLIPCTVSAVDSETFQWDVEKETLLAGLWEADITTIREALDLGLISCVELTQYYLDRINTYNETYNCFITLCDDALEQAAACDEKIAAGTAEGKLLGIPMVIKDNMDYAGYHTTSGHTKKDSQIADSNARVVQYILDEGAIIIGKTNMSTDAQDARASTSAAVGQTKNAYNSFMASGGSSGGSAVATSLNFAVAGLGTDTNSSLRFPAVLNGCVALRVTWDTLSMDGIDKLNSTRDVPGAITRSVKDQAILLDVLSGGVTNYADNLDPDVLDGLRIGVLKELSYPLNSFRSEENIDDEVEAAFADAVAELEACGAVVVEISISNVLNLADRTMSSNKSELKEAMYEKIVKTMTESDVSAVIFPSYLHTPLRSGRDTTGTYWDVYSQTYINNTSQFSSCASLPEIGVPIDYHSLGAGIGMEIATLRNQEQLLLDIAYAYTTRYDHRLAPMNAADLYAQHNEGTLSQLIEDYHSKLAAFEAAAAAPEETQAGETGASKKEDPADTLIPNKEKSPNTVFIVLLVVIAVCVILICVFLSYLSYQKKRRKRRNRRSAGQYVKR